MFNRIRALHKVGYVHRDIKLNNYVCALNDEESVIKKNKDKDLGMKLTL